MCDTWPHHRLLHADELRNAPSPFFISLEKSLLKVIWARADSPALGLAVRGGELFGLLTWMNCWGNVEAGNGWIVYINMINIALINHLSVIYCRFSHLALTRKLWRISQWSFLSSQRRFWVFSRSFSEILVLHSSHMIRVRVPDGSWLVCVRFCVNSCWGGKTEANAKATTCARGLNVLSDQRVHNILFRALRMFSFWAKFCFSFLLSEQERCVFKAAQWFPVRRTGCAERPAISHDQPPL